MKQLSGLDATFLHLETAEMPMHVGSLNVYELPAGMRGKYTTHLRQLIKSRLPATPALRRRVWWMPLNLANPAWVDADPDLRLHIVEHKLPPSAKLGDGMAALEAAVSELHPVLLDRSRPLWKFHVLEGLADSAEGRRRVAVYSQLHHAAVDGQAAVALAQVLMDLQPSGRDLALRPGVANKVFKLGWAEMLRGAIGTEASQVSRIVKALPSTVSALAGAAGQALQHSALLRGKAEASGNLSLAPRTAFNQSVSAGRAFAALSLPLDRLKAIARGYDATLNDIVLLLCATALRRWLGQHGGVPRKSLVAAVPISLRSKGDTAANNQASMSLVSLGTHVADLHKRFDYIKQASADMKSTMGGLKRVLPTDYPSIGMPWLMEAAVALYGKAKVADRLPLVANLVISNVPGPPVPLYLAGARLLSNFPTSIVVHGMALNITVQSYDQQMDFGMMADARAMPDVRSLADALRLAFDDLCLWHDEVNAPPSLTDTGLAVAAQARKRLLGGLGDLGGRVGSAMGRAVSEAVGLAVGKAVNAATRPPARRTPVAKAASRAAPAPSKGAAKATAKTTAKTASPSPAKARRKTGRSA